MPNEPSHSNIRHFLEAYPATCIMCHSPVPPNIPHDCPVERRFREIIREELQAWWTGKRSGQSESAK